MDKCLYKGVDIFNPIEGKLKYFIDAFAAVYGEQHRGVIEKRLNNSEYFFLGGKFSNIILKYQDLEKEEIKKIEMNRKLPPRLAKLKKKEIHEKYQFIINVFQETQKNIDITAIKYNNIINDLFICRISYIKSVISDFIANNKMFLIPM